MWCRHCRQDVPALPSADKQSLCCPRCGAAVCTNLHAASGGAAAADSPANDPSGATANPAAGLPWYDGWELDEQLRHIERVLQTTKAQQRETEAADRREAMRFDLAHAVGPDWHVPAARPAADRRKAGVRRSAASSVLTWLSLALGTTSFVCGGTLLGWSLATGRQELWNVGLPLSLAGQIALLAGLVLQIERLWHGHRATTARLDNVGRQLHELKTTTTVLSTSQGPTSSVFYSHLANGAGPQLLLTDLKSQLDLLAIKIAQEQSADG
jgi:hypothetical protein